MKKLFITAALAAFALTASAQVDKNDNPQDEIQDKIQQEPPRENQSAVENAAQRADANANGNKNDRKADEILKKETELSTGKEAKNPAKDNPKTVKPVQTPEPPKQKNWYRKRSLI